MEPNQIAVHAANRKVWFVRLGKTFSYIYQATALHVFNVIVAFALVNAALSITFSSKDTFLASRKNQVADKYRAGLNTVYPWLSQREIDQLLLETWARPFGYEPYTDLTERPYRGLYVNVDENGFRISKNQGAWPPDPKVLNIFLFGGSTTFGYGVPDDHTIASHLQDYLSPKLKRTIKVYNFGRGFYFSTQERILLEQIVSSGAIPHIAIFIDGMNEFYHTANRPKFADLLQRLIDEAERGDRHYLGIEYLMKLPVGRAASALMRRLGGGPPQGMDDVNPGSGNVNAYEDASMINRIVDRYLENKKLIEAATGAYRIQPVFVWQPAPMYNYDNKYHLFAGSSYGKLGYSTYGYHYMKQLLTKIPMGGHFLWCADMQQDLREPLYVDGVHYGSKLSNMIAIAIGDYLIENKLIQS